MVTCACCPATFNYFGCCSCYECGLPLCTPCHSALEGHCESCFASKIRYADDWSTVERFRAAPGEEMTEQVNLIIDGLVDAIHAKDALAG